jgi:hypothetical protein
MSIDRALSSADRADVEPEKVRDYLLSPEHPIGQFKAMFFRALGYQRDRWQVLHAALVQAARTGVVETAVNTPYGRKYELSGTLEGPAGRSAEITSIWIVRADGDNPRFVTAYPR